MDTQAISLDSLRGNQNNLTINNYTAPTYTLNGRPASAEDTHDFLLGRTESAERELEAHKATIQAQQEQIYLQQEIMRQLRQEVSRLQDNIDQLMECNTSLNQLIAVGVRKRA